MIEHGMDIDIVAVNILDRVYLDGSDRAGQGRGDLLVKFTNPHVLHVRERVILYNMHFTMLQRIKEKQSELRYK